MSVESDLRTFLIGPGAAKSTCTSAMTYVGPQRKRGGTVPDRAVFITEYGGPKPHGFLHQDSTETYRKTDVQVWVRGAPNTYLTTKALADAVWIALDRPYVASVSSTTVSYVKIEPMNSAPLWLGEDDQERPQFAVNVRAESQITP